MTDLLQAMPPSTQIILLIVYGIMTGLIGGAAAKRKDAQTKSWLALVESQGKGLTDMQVRIDGLQADVIDCEKMRAQDRRDHALDLADLREKHAREVGELQGQITTLRHMLKGG